MSTSRTPKKKDRVVVVQRARQELFAGRDAGSGLEEDRTLRDGLRIGPDDGVIRPGPSSEPLDGGQRVRDGLVLIAAAHVGPGQDALGQRGSGARHLAAGRCGRQARVRDEQRRHDTRQRHETRSHHHRHGE